MRRMLSGLLIAFIITGVCACGRSDNNMEEESANIKEEIAQVEEHAVGENESISVAASMGEDGKLADYIDISVADTYVETDKITKASLDLLEDVTGAFIDDKGNLLEDYSFVGVKLNINSEKNLNINTSSFILRGINDDKYFDASCFYQDGKRPSSDIHQGGVAEIRQGMTEITVGFFADEEMMKCKKFFLQPTMIETEDNQNNYIEITIR